MKLAQKLAVPKAKKPLIPNVPEWVHDAIFYQIFPDRYARSTKAPDLPYLENWNATPTFHGFKGGDIYGIIERLSQIKESGFNAIYLTPIFQSAANHRYVTFDYFQVDPMLGGNDALHELINKAHRLGMKIVLDGVFNHTGRGFFAFNHIMENGAQSPYLDWFHINPEWLKKKKPLLAFPTKEQSTRKNIESFRDYGYKAWWNLPALPKLNTNTPAVREYIFLVAEHWAKFGIDGWRLDVPGDIDDDSFWREFRKRVKKINPELYIVGEIWDEADRWLQGDQFDAVMNYLLGKPILAASLSKKPLREITNRSHYANISPMLPDEFQSKAKYAIERYHPNISLAQMNLLGSHDTPRITSLFNGDFAGLKMALTLLYTMPGAPCVYYGDEIAMEGAHDPDCRRGFPPNLKKHLATHRHANEIREHVKSLAKLRTTQKSLRKGSITFLEIPSVVAFVRHTKGCKPCLILANTSNSNITVDSALIPQKLFPCKDDEISIAKRSAIVLT